MKVNDGASLSKLELATQKQAEREVANRAEGLTIAQEGAVIRSNRNLWRKVRRFDQ